MRLDGAEFVRRFALHVLPHRFVRVRYYGFLAHRGRLEHLARCRALIAAGGHGVPAEPVELTEPAGPPRDDTAARDTDGGEGDGVPRCPKCQAMMLRVRFLQRGELYDVEKRETRAPPGVRC